MALFRSDFAQPDPVYGPFRTLNPTKSIGNPMAPRFPGTRATVNRYLNSSIHQAGVKSLKESLGIGFDKSFIGRTMRFAGPLMLGHAIYSGYQEGGLSGALMGGAEYAANMYMWGAGLKIAGIGLSGLGVGLGVGLAGAGLAGGLALGVSGIGPRQMLRPLVREHMERRSRLEMGTPIVDDYGSIATMRQRSIMAIQNSKINGRTALGNEASLLR